MKYEEFEKKLEAIKALDPMLHGILALAWEDLLWRSRRGYAETPGYQAVLDMVIASVQEKTTARQNENSPEAARQA